MRREDARRKGHRIMCGTPPLLEPDAEVAWELLVLGAGEPPAAPLRDTEGAAWFRAQLQELGFTQGTFARFMLRRGDIRPKRNVLRSIQRMCAGQVRVPGEMRVLLGVMLRSKQRGMAQRARVRDEREAPWNDLPEACDGGSEREGPRQAGGDGETPPDGLSEPRSEVGSDRKAVRQPGNEAGGESGARPAGLSEPRGEGGPHSEVVRK